MTYGDIALYASVALALGMVGGIAWGGVSAFVRALLH